MENEQEKVVLDKNLERDIKECKKHAEFLEKVLTMLVRGFAPEF